MKLRLVLFLVLCAAAFGQGVVTVPKTVLSVVNGVTRPVANATITVCRALVGGSPCSPPLVGSLFKDAALTQPLSNPFTTDANGNYQFAIANGTYTVTETASGFAGYSYQYQAGNAGLLLPNPANFPGPVTVPVFNTIHMVNFLTVGADLCAKMTNADTFGSVSGELWIDPSAGLTCSPSSVYTSSGPRKIKFIGTGASYSIPMGSWVFPYATSIDCGGRQQAVLNFTGSSGIAIPAKWAQYPQGSFSDWGYEVDKCAIWGPGGVNGGNANAGTGIQVGDATHATIGFKLVDSEVCGFGVGITWGNVGAWGTEIDFSNFCNNGTWSGGVQQTAANLLWNLSSAGGAENLLIQHSTFNQTNAVPVLANDFTISGSGVLELTVKNSSFDSSQRYINGSSQNLIKFEEPHTEITVNSNVVPLVVTAGAVVETSPFYTADGASVVPPEFVNVTGGSYSLTNGTWKSLSQAVTNNVVASGGSTGSLINPNLFTSLVGGASVPATWLILDPALGIFNLPGKTTVGGLNLTNLLISPTAPTIAGGGCGGSGASIVANPNGTAAFKVNVGATPGSACTLTMPASTTGWNCSATDITTNSTSVFHQKQTGAESTTAVTITNLNDVAVATAFVASDILKLTCGAD